MRIIGTYLSTLIFLLSTGLAAQKNASKKYYEEGNVALKNGDFKTADSLFNLSANISSSPNTYFNIATCRGKLGDKPGYCINLRKASMFGDREADSLFWKKCSKTEVIYKSGKNEIADKTDYKYKEIIMSCSYINYYGYQRMDRKDEILEAYEVTDGDTIFIKTDEMPDYEGGVGEMYKFIGSNIRYPMEAKENGISGKVFVMFQITQTGTIKDFQILKGMPGCLDCQVEVISVLKLLPAKWVPAKMNHRPVNTKFMMPVNFKIG